MNYRIIHSPVWGRVEKACGERRETAFYVYFAVSEYCERTGNKFFEVPWEDVADISTSVGIDSTLGRVVYDSICEELSSYLMERLSA